MLDLFFQKILPVIIEIIEIMGITIIVYGTIKAFIFYVINIFAKKDLPVKFVLTSAMAMGLEFKIASEILRTVLVQTLEEFLLVGCIIALRAILSILIHYDVKKDREEEELLKKEGE